MVGPVDIGRETADQRLVVAEVAVRQPVHDDLAQRVERRGRALLRDALVGRVAAQVRVELGDGDGHRPAERGIRGRGPVDVEGEELEVVLRGVVRAGVVRLVVAVPHEDPGRPRGRRRRAVEVGRGQHLEAERIQRGRREALVGRGGAGEHVGSVERVDRGRAFVRAEVVGVGPDGVLRVVRELGEREDVVVPAAADRVRRLRHVDAQVVARRGELGDQPALRELVVEHDRVAAARRAGAGAAQRRERERAGDDGAVGLVVDRVVRGAAAVDGLDVVGRADVADRVRRVDAGVALRAHVDAGRGEGAG